MHSFDGWMGPETGVEECQIQRANVAGVMQTAAVA